MVFYVFRRLRPIQEIYAFHMTIPESEKSFNFYGHEHQSYFNSHVVRNIHLTCQSNETRVSLDYPNKFVVGAVNLYIENIQVDNCEFSNVNPDLKFLKKLTVSRTKDFPFQHFYFNQVLLTSFTTLHTLHIRPKNFRVSQNPHYPNYPI